MGKKRRFKNSWLWKKISKIKFEADLKRKVKEKREKCKKCIFIIATPCHNNLGDHAIVYAEYNFFEKLGFKENIVEISNMSYHRYKNILKKYIIDDDIVIIDGGGSLGTLWSWEDDKISEIISTYKNNNVILFPQTCYYDENEDISERISRNAEIYNSANKLRIFLRDERSYNYFTKTFPGVNVFYVPDIVMSLSDIKISEKRENCMLCFRADKEKVISDECIKKIENYLEENSVEYRCTSTMAEKSVYMSDRTEELYKKWREFSSAKFIITDRLHGMIFCAITRTPCIAIDNISHKVKEGYKWFEHLPYIRFCDGYDEIIKQIDIFSDWNECNEYDIGNMENHYNILVQEVKKAYNED